MTRHNLTILQRLLLVLSLVFCLMLTGCIEAQNSEDDDTENSAPETEEDGSAGSDGDEDQTESPEENDETDPAESEKPAIAFIATNGSPVQPGGQIEIRIDASSPDGRPLRYEWDIPAEWSGEDTGDRALVLTAPEKQAAADTVSVTASNEAGSRTASVQVATKGPVIENLSVIPSSEQPGRITVQVDAYNHRGTPLDYHYEIDGILFEDQASEWQWSTTMAGDYRVQALVRDEDGLTATASTDFSLNNLSPWPSFGGGPHRRGQARTTQRQGPVTEIKWEIPVELASEAGPIMGMTIGPRGTLYFGSSDHHLHALNPEDGSTKWRFPTDGPIGSTPAVGPDGSIYFGSTDGFVYALNPDNGSLKWRHETGDKVLSSPSIGGDGTLYVGSNDHHLYALNSEDGSKKWAYKMDEESTASPTLDGQGTVYAGSADNHLYALDTENGNLKWRFETDNGIHSSPTVGPEGIVYFGSGDGNLYALNPVDGSEVWRHETDLIILASPALSADGILYVGSFDGYLYALNATDGAEKWSAENAAIISSPAIGADGTIYVGSSLEGFLALDPEDGSSRREYETGPAVAMSPAIGADGTIYVASGETFDEGVKIHALH